MDIYQTDKECRFARMDNEKRFKMKNSSKDYVILDDEKLKIKGSILYFREIKGMEITDGYEDTFNGIPKGLPVMTIRCFDGRVFVLFKTTGFGAKSMMYGLKQAMEQRISLTNAAQKGGGELKLQAQQGPQAQQGLQEDVIFEKISKLLQVSSRVKIDDLVEMLGVKRAYLLEKMIEWSSRLSVVIDGDFLVVKKEDVDAATLAYKKKIARGK